MKPSALPPPASAFLAFPFFLWACGDASGTGPPEPEAPAPATMSVSPERITVDALGEVVRFTATVWDQMGRVLPDATVTWYSSDEAVAPVSAGGLATAVGDGTTTILGAASPSVFGWGEMTVTAKPLAIVTSTLPPGVVGLPYSQFLEGVGATAPTWSISSGALPHGLTLNGSTGEISGTPTLFGNSAFTVALSGNGQTVTRRLAMVVVREDLGVGFEVDQFALIPAGSFQMGSENGWVEERPVHTVNLTRPFLMQKTEVTQHQWRAIMGNNPSGFLNCGEVCPVERVSWENARAFIEALNAADPGKNYRLPTEAEWEYAARAGTTGDYGGTGILAEMGWYVENSGSRTQFVGQKEPNAWGLYDMHGNVSEWVHDWLSDTYYAESPSDDPPGPPTGTYRVFRGGSADRNADWATSWRRLGNPPGLLAATRGFRLVRDP